MMAVSSVVSEALESSMVNWAGSLVDDFCKLVSPLTDSECSQFWVRFV